MRSEIKKSARKDGRDPAIFEEWDALVWPTYKEPRAVWIRERWQVLWDKHISDDNLLRTHHADAALICSLGYSLAMHDRNYAEAELRVRRWFQHPDALSCYYERNSMREQLAWTLLFQHKIADAAAEIRAILEDVPEKRTSIQRSLARNLLAGWFDELADPDAKPDPELARLAAIVLGQIRDRKRAASHIESGEATNSDIARYLDSTYNARN